MEWEAAVAKEAMDACELRRDTADGVPAGLLRALVISVLPLVLLRSEGLLRHSSRETALALHCPADCDCGESVSGSRSSCVAADADSDAAAMPAACPVASLPSTDSTSS